MTTRRILAAAILLSACGGAVAPSPEPHHETVLDAGGLYTIPIEEPDGGPPPPPKRSSAATVAAELA